MSRGIAIIFINITTITIIISNRFTIIISIIISTIMTAVLVEREWSKARGLSNGRWPEVACWLLATTTILGMGWACPGLGLSKPGPIPGLDHLWRYLCPPGPSGPSWVDGGWVGRSVDSRCHMRPENPIILLKLTKTSRDVSTLRHMIIVALDLEQVMRQYGVK